MGPVLATGMVLSWSFLLQLWLPNTEEWYEDVDEIPVFNRQEDPESPPPGNQSLPSRSREEAGLSRERCG